MRLAVFTNQFPGRLNTFFARDLRALIESGIELEVFAFYPLRAEYWSAVPALLDTTVLPRHKVHHISPAALLQAGSPWPPRLALSFLRSASPLLGASVRQSRTLGLKAAYVSAWAWACVKRFGAERFDHVLAYWGNHAASAAYLFHQHTQPAVPFSMLVHARMDLYHQPAYLDAKLAYADNIFIVCEYNRGYLREHFPAVYPQIASRIQVHHLGLPLEQIPVTLDDRPPDRLLAVGHLEPLKGFAVLLRALAVLRDRGLTPTLEIVGGGPDEASLRALAHECQVAGQVTLLGWLSAEQVMARMQGATMLVHPSIAPDAMPTVVKEALACGTPVVASDLAGIPEMLDGGRCGVLVPPGDVTALADSVERLLREPATRRALGAAGRAHMEAHFDLWENGRRLAHVLRDSRRAPHADMSTVA
ncbi:MAG TPA: glycosyltransferase [Gemmatimonadales bacterium]|nr:glycosyltransferase [Gemmatimonadales bacterium]